MKIKYTSKTQKVRIRSEWHKKFVFFPKRVADDEFQFLINVGRKLHTTGKETRWYRWCFLNEYKYKDLQQVITDKLMNK